MILKTLSLFLVLTCSSGLFANDDGSSSGGAPSAPTTIILFSKNILSNDATTDDELAGLNRQFAQDIASGKVSEYKVGITSNPWQGPSLGRAVICVTYKNTAALYNVLEEVQTAQLEYDSPLSCEGIVTQFVVEPSVGPIVPQYNCTYYLSRPPEDDGLPRDYVTAAIRKNLRSGVFETVLEANRINGGAINETVVVKRQILERGNQVTYDGQTKANENFTIQIQLKPTIGGVADATMVFGVIRFNNQVQFPLQCMVW